MLLRPLVSVLFLVLPTFAQAPPGYYSSVVSSSAASLRLTLHQVIDDHTRIPYTSSQTDTWDVLNQADEDPLNSSHIVDVYRNASYQKIGGGIGVYNREHTWPKSYGFPNDVPDNYPYPDCHQLYLCDGGYNSSRSNRPFAFTNAFANERVTVSTNGAGGGGGVYPGNSNWYDSIGSNGRWEAWADRRGDVARALFYLDIRYEGGVHGITGSQEPNLILTDNINLVVQSNTGNNEQVAYMGYLSTLLQWHDADPVDQRDLDRNDVVFSYQGNRNPFVDHPEWVDCLFANQCSSSTAPAAPQSLIAIHGIQQLWLDWADNSEPDLAGYRVYRSNNAGGPYTEVSTSLVTMSLFQDVGLTGGVDYYYVVRAENTAGLVSPDSNEAHGRPGSPATVWINELHYENVGTDAFEFVELAGPAGTNLAGWALFGYDGASGLVYATWLLGGSLPNESIGFGARAFKAQLQNGPPDGIALVNPAGLVVSLLSYEGLLFAANGPAAGMLSSVIPTLESSFTPTHMSLQLQGTGRASSHFVWSVPMPLSPGRLNAGQRIGDR